MRRAWQSLGRSDGFGAALAALALVLQVLFPAGFMAADPGQAVHGIPIVICTAEGRVTATWDGATDRGSKKTPAKPMAACAFAGHAATSPPPPAPQTPSVAVAFLRQPDAPSVAAAFPGRGLAAPPPPAIGPPLQA